MQTTQPCRYTYLLAALVCFHLSVPASALAQWVAFSTKEKYGETILKLGDFSAQCINKKDRAVFKYVKNLKRLSWYRDEYYTVEEELQVNELSAGIILKDTGKPRIPGYVDIRDVQSTENNEAKPLVRTKRDFVGIYWIDEPRPKYTASDCENQVRALMRDIPKLEAKIPPPFPELKGYFALTEPEEFLKISKKIGFCFRDGKRPLPLFARSTRFEAWISNSFSMSYGDKEKLSRPLYAQYQKEMNALGSMGEAAQEIDFGGNAEKNCDMLEQEMMSYDSRHPAL